MAKKLWGGRFAKATDPLVEEFTKSLHYDQRLAEHDLLGSMLHVEILRKAGYLENAEAAKLYKGLNAIRKSVKSGIYEPDPDSEDVHTDIQNKLEAKVGKLALKLHTARSRNDQVAFSTKLYSKITLLELQILLADLVASISKAAEKNKAVIIPGFTHMQHAQPVYLKDYLYAYVEMIKRDNKRLSDAFKNIKLTMGAGALAGTPIDAAKYKIEAGAFAKSFGCDTEDFNVNMTLNSLDAVSDRDFVIDILSALALVGMHLSRLSEDLIIWSTKEFGFVSIDDAFCTGSSLMPQKKNADVMELVRGYAGRLYGNLMGALTMMKGLPLTYNRDMQLDKEPLFNSFDIVSIELKVLKGLIDTIKFNKEAIEKYLEDEALYATDIVYYLVKKGMAFKDAHTTVGKLVKYSADYAIKIKDMTESDLKKLSNLFVKKDIVRLFDPRVSVESKKSIKR